MKYIRTFRQKIISIAFVLFRGDGKTSSAKFRYSNFTRLLISGIISNLLFSFSKKYFSFNHCGVLRKDQSLYSPAIALRIILGLISVARIVIFQSIIFGIILFSAIAIEYGSSPVEHPALQILILFSFCRKLISTGRISCSNVSKV